MIEVIVFAGLIGFVAGALHLYHHYVTVPAAKQDAQRIEMLRGQLGDIRLRLRKLEKEFDAFQVRNYMDEPQKGDVLDFGIASAAEIDEDNDDADEHMTMLQQGARTKLASLAEVRAQLPLSAVGPGWSKLDID